MPTTETLPVKDLKLDLKNPRTVPQASEAAALRAMVAISPDWFWALMESLLEDGYHQTENIIVQRVGPNLVVKEGNRRIAALKLAHGFLRKTGVALPGHIEDMLSGLSRDWKKENLQVPCAVFEASEDAQVAKIVNMTHGKGDRAGRSKWGPVAKARYNRDVLKGSEPGLDLLEKYLLHGKNLTPNQAERWTGDYLLTVLDEALKRAAPRMGYASSRALADAYPKVAKHKALLDKVLHDVGIGALTFQHLRDDALGDKYGMAAPAPAPSAAGSVGGPGGATPTTNGATGAKSAAARKAAAAVALSDPRSVERRVKAFIPRGQNREKLMTLLVEARRLKLSTPHAFCFVLRSMFEISAKAYCDDHAAAGLTTVKNGRDRPLVDVLRDIYVHMTSNNTDRQMQKKLHGAMSALGSPDNILSVTSMNQLVHNPRFSILEGDIAGHFHNIFPLLEEMNK